MVMNASSRAEIDTLRELAFGSITGAYAALGTPLGHQVRIMTLQNQTDQTLYFSDDGINNKFKYQAGGGEVLDFMTNQSGYAESFSYPAGKQWYVKAAGALPASGSAILSVVYGKGE